MIDPKLGTRRICPSCRAPHFDLNKIPAKCPKCNHSYDPNEPVLPKRRRRTKAEVAKEEAAAKLKVVPVPDEIEMETDDVLDGEDNVSLEDLEELEDGEDDLLEIEGGKESPLDDEDEEGGIEGMEQRLIDDFDDEEELEEEEE